VAYVRSCDAERDIAIVELHGELPIVSTRSATALKIGEPVYAVGAPRGLDLSISEGIVSQLRGAEVVTRTMPLIQTTAAISPGSSGGGLFDAQGRLVGITTLYLKDAQSLNFAIPSDWIAEAPTRGTVRATSKNTSPSSKPPPSSGEPHEPQSQCRWEKLSETNDTHFFFDRCTIKSQAQYRTVWELRNYKTPQRDAPGKLRVSDKLRWAVDCANDRTALMGWVSYRGPMGARGTSYTQDSIPEQSWNFTDVEPESAHAALVREACR